MLTFGLTSIFLSCAGNSGEDEVENRYDMIHRD